MKNFIFNNPTKLVFGKGQIAKLAELLPSDKKIMVTYGGGSVKANGVYDQVIAALEGKNYTEFWGIEPNPTVETLRKAIEKGMAEGVEFLLAVGGGSVLDGTKLIAAGMANGDKEPWDIVISGYCGTALPYASVMTLPATGSEMNNGAVISRTETKEKRAFYTTYPLFSILDPQTTYSLPQNQIANGVTDVFVHIMEQYLTTCGQSGAMDRWAEGLLMNIMEVAPKLKQGEDDYDVRAEFMLTATLALNGMIAMGVTQDWASHMIGHEITALTGIAHGASLAIVLPGVMRTLSGQKKGKLLQYGSRVLGICEGSEQQRIDRTIAATEEFFRSIGQATRLGESGVGQDVIDAIVARFESAGSAFGENANVDSEVTRRILESCK